MLRLISAIYRYILASVAGFVMLFGVNLSFVFFLLFFFKLFFKYPSLLLSPNNIFKCLAYFFAIGSVVSAIFSQEVLQSIRVLPNYLYWASLILIFSSLRDRVLLTPFGVSRSVFFGILLYIIYFFVQTYFNFPLFLKTIQLNNLAYTVTCAFPFALYYCRKQFSLSVSWLFYIVTLLLLLFLDRRTGFFLNLLSGYFTLNMDQFFAAFNNSKRIVIAVFLVLSIFFAVSTPFASNIISAISPRIHTALYKSGTLVETDRSYLMRKALLEKGVIIFNRYPVFGSGLNTFTTIRNIDIPGNFAGSKYVLKKDLLYKTSPHNSYIGLIAEGGLVLAIPFFGLFSMIYARFLLHFKSLSDLSRLSFISLFSLSLYLILYHGIVNSLTWFVFALSIYSLQARSKKNTFKRSDVTY